MKVRPWIVSEDETPRQRWARIPKVYLLFLLLMIVIHFFIESPSSPFKATPTAPETKTATASGR